MIETPVMTTAARAAHRAGEALLELFGKAGVSEKAYNNLVTDADYRSERIIIDTIHETFPDHRCLSEESFAEEQRDADHCWIIDPLDGTNNYAHGVPFSSVSIAYAEAGSVLAAAILDPFRNELFTAARGSGAFLNGDRITVSARSGLTGALISTGFYYNQNDIVAKTLSATGRLYDNGMSDIRRTGSAALDLCYTASGRFDGYFEYELGVWDFAAGMLVVNEAGGRCSDRMGNPLDLFGRGVIVSNGKIHPDLVSNVKWNL